MGVRCPLHQGQVDIWDLVKQECRRNETGCFVQDRLQYLFQTQTERAPASADDSFLSRDAHAGVLCSGTWRGALRREGRILGHSCGSKLTVRPQQPAVLFQNSPQQSPETSRAGPRAGRGKEKQESHAKIPCSTGPAAGWRSEIFPAKALVAVAKQGSGLHSQCAGMAGSLGPHSVLCPFRLWLLRRQHADVGSQHQAEGVCFFPPFPPTMAGKEVACFDPH